MTAEGRPELDDDELDTLMEALEAWEQKDAAGEMMGDIVEGLLIGPKGRGVGPLTSSQIEQDMARHQDKQRRVKAKIERKERSIILRAKLLTIRNQRRVERLEASCRTNTP